MDHDMTRDIFFVPDANGTARSLPIKGSTSANLVTPVLMPDLDRHIWLVLTGTFQGTVTVLRDGVPLTAGGQPYAIFTAPMCEPIIIETQPGKGYSLDIKLTSGTLTYELAQ